MRIISDIPDLAAIAPAWNRLADRVGSHWCVHEWFYAAAKAL
jgi:hypothetical protein